MNQLASSFPKPQAEVHYVPEEKKTVGGFKGALCGKVGQYYNICTVKHDRVDSAEYL